MIMSNTQTVNHANTASIHQKRTLAFVNHFVIKTVQFMNNFAVQCEKKLLDFELKMQKVEASLIILETKLASIPDSPEDIQVNTENQSKEVEEIVDKDDIIDVKTLDDTQQPVEESAPEPPKERDSRYDRFFKMVQVGVPVQAVKIKIASEGLNPNMLDQ